MNETEQHEERSTGRVRERRHALQSRALVAVVGALLVVSTVMLFSADREATREFPAQMAAAIAASLFFAAIVRFLRAATLGGALCGALVCLLLTYGREWMSEPVWHRGLLPLACLFVLTFAATRIGLERKQQAGLAENRRGRDAAQVLANLSAAALCVSPLTEWALRYWGTAVGAEHHFADLWTSVVMRVAAVAVLAEATADTVSSEIGQAFGGRPVMIFSMRRVKPGTDGAISLVGTATGALGAMIVAAAGAWAMHLGLHGAVVAWGAGIVGLFTDTILGATVERRGWIGNDLVNFLSTVSAAAVAIAATRF